MNVGATTAAVVAAARTRCINAFRGKRAVSPQTAVAPEDIGVRRNMVFKRLVKEEVLCAVTDNTYYLDEARDAEVNKKSRKLVAALLLIIALVLLAVLISSHFA